MAASEDFLSKEEEREVVEAIQNAEKETSGEIRVHLEETSAEDPFVRATALFEALEMHKTALKNGVLIYMAIQDHKFAICGDKGIDDVVPEHFWDDTKELMLGHFKSGDFKSGLIAGIKRAGEKLQQFFPCGDDDIDELSNEISRN